MAYYIGKSFEYIYIYKPLGGSRKGLVRTCINLFLTFIVSGLWHGAAWTFVVWGALHGLIIVLERIFKASLSRIPRALRVIVTFISVNFLWVLFRAENFSQALKIYKGMFDFKNIKITQLSDIAFDSIINFPTIIDIGYLVCVIGGLLFIVFKAQNSKKMVDSFKLNRKTALISAGLFSVSLLHMLRESVFIYFNF